MKSNVLVSRAIEANIIIKVPTPLVLGVTNSLVRLLLFYLPEGYQGVINGNMMTLSAPKVSYLGCSRICLTWTKRPNYEEGHFKTSKNCNFFLS